MDARADLWLYCSNVFNWSSYENAHFLGFFIADVFSLQFANPVARSDLPAVRNGIYDILKLLNCHDSSKVYVSLVDNSISK